MTPKAIVPFTDSAVLPATVHVAPLSFPKGFSIALRLCKRTLTTMPMKALFLFVIFIACQLAAHSQIITTIAGGGTAQPGDGGPATDCKLNEPIGVAVDAADNIYIAERAKHCIRKIDPSGTITIIAGSWGVAGYSGDGGVATAAKLNMPYGITLDGSGNIYFSEQLNFCIRKINASGVISTVAGNGTVGYSGDGGPATNAQFAGAGFFTLDNLGNIYIPDYDNHCIRKVDASGIISTIAGGNGVDGPGKTGDGGQATDAKMNRPQGVARDAVGNLYVAEYGSNIIRKISASGIITTVAGTGTEGYNGEDIPATGAQIKKPLDVIVDQYDNLYISEPYNYRVRKVTAGGVISTVAGTGMNGFSGDGGPATAATFQGISGICFDASGDMYINDAGNNRLRKALGLVHVQDKESSSTYTLSVYPVPNNGVFTVKLEGGFAVASEQFLRITSVDGMQILEKHIALNAPEELNLSLPAGLYFLSVHLGTEVLNRTIAVTN